MSAPPEHARVAMIPRGLDAAERLRPMTDTIPKPLPAGCAVSR